MRTYPSKKLSVFTSAWLVSISMSACGHKAKTTPPAPARPNSVRHMDLNSIAMTRAMDQLVKISGASPEAVMAELALIYKGPDPESFFASLDDALNLDCTTANGCTITRKTLP